MRAFFFGGKELEMPEEKKPTKLKIQYDGHDQDLEFEIFSLLKSQGFEWCGQESNMITGTRELNFKRHPGMR